MKAFLRALGIELMKGAHSKITLLTLIGVSLGPLAGGLFMYILQDPERARSMGMIGTKASIAGVADWASLYKMLIQVVVAGGAIIYAFAMAWVFGREYSDRTIRVWLAVPTPRTAVVTAKLVLVTCWCTLLTGWIIVLGTVMGFVVGLPGFSMSTFSAVLQTTCITGLMTLLLLTPVAFIASAARGYLPAIGFAIFSMFIANLGAAMGWGTLVPWCVPALYSGIAGPEQTNLGLESYLSVGLTSLLGLVGTYWWWKRADQLK